MRRRVQNISLPRGAPALVTLIVCGQVIAVFSDSARTPIFGLSLLLLDLLGAIFSWKASYRCAARTSWRLLSAGRGLSLLSTTAFTVDAIAPAPAWWWTGVMCGLAMFASYTASVLTMAALRLHGQRVAFIAEVVAVLASGFLLVWFGVINPALSQQTAHAHTIFEIGYPLGNLVLLSAVTAVFLRSGVTSLTRPLMSASIGILLYAISDIGFSAARVYGEQATDSAAACAGLVLASLLMTVAAMWQAATSAGEDVGHTRMPAWSAHAPFVAVGAGSIITVLATVEEHHATLWTGLVLGQITMTVALATRQIMFLRDSRRQNVTDALTGLTNVTGLRQAMHKAASVGGHALLLIDLDGFKAINDGYGHAVGDDTLIAFARLLRAAIRRSDVAARIGGDEFVVLIQDAPRTEQAIAVAERILTALTEHPVPAGADSITIRASIGLATATPGDSAEDLQRRADLAMYESKRSGNHSYLAYHSGMTDRRTRDRLIGERLPAGLAEGEFEVRYQPIVRMSTSTTMGYEALLRWHAADLGAIPPSEFIPIAEHTGAIVELGLWVLEQACSQLQRWRTNEQQSELFISVNISPRQLQNPEFVDDVLSVLDRCGLPASRLTLEITESAIVDEEVAIPALERLRAQGVQVSIDDFGTGYSSLHYLTRLPVDALKIDRSFVGQLEATPRGASVTEAIIRLAQVLGLRVIAEGIETPEQSAELQMLGCDVGQGYLFARPMSVAQTDAYRHEAREKSSGLYEHRV